MSIPQGNVDVAIIGMSCRFPGAASVEEYWKNLCLGVESVTFFSDQELLAAGVDPALVANPNYVKAAPMLRDVETFDASFFGYSPKDAALMDPQQRLFLEVCWEAFENAGYNPFEHPGKVGVLSTGGGVVSSYLLAKLHHSELPGQTASISHINNDKDFLSTRVSFKLNLRGPSFTIQSACSSSLVAVHQACQNLRFNECDMMLVGGSVVRVPQIAGYLAEKRNLHSLDGHCRPFDSVGQGTIFGSGVGAVLIKPLKQAIADRDHIFAVIKGTAANNDGSAKSSYTAPSLDQQSQAVVDALAMAGVSPDSVSYLECHSTGTIVGDPLEVEALSKAFRTGTERQQYCAIGSLKANIGHPEQAAGIAGIIKAALVLHHKQIPPSINYDTPNPAIDFASSPFYVNTKLRDFASGDTPRRAGLNSLGIGGTNVFAVLEEAPPVATTERQSSDARPNVITLSAKSADALVARIEQLLTWLNDNPDAPIGDVCYTTNVSRSQFAFRFAVHVQSTDDLKAQLATWLRTSSEDASSRKQTSNAPIAFMFSGQGSQHAGMTALLYRSHSVFRRALDRCCALAQPHLELDLLDVIFAEGQDDALVNRTDYTQPALFAVEYALAELLKSWGIKPDAVIGHSLGEFAAACAADIMSLEDAMRLVVARGALMHGLPSGGSMVSIMAEELVVRPLIEKIAPEIAIAALNGPLNTVVSGDRAALKMLAEELDRQGLTHRELRISNGFHSPRTEPILDDLESVAAEIQHSAPKLPFISNVTGEVMTDAPDKAYWRRHTRQSVRFGDGMLALSGLGYKVFLEVGPHPVLLPLAQACLQAKGERGTWIPTLNRQKPDAEALSEMLVALYLAGQTINWAAVHSDSSWRRIPLPTYPFQRKRHWIDGNSADMRDVSNRAMEQVHPLVGERIKSTPEETCYEVRYGVRQAAYLSDHRVAGTVVLPTTVELEAATAVGRMHFGTARTSLDSAMHHQAMAFGDGEERVVRISLSSLKSDKASFRLESASAQEPARWQTHMTGTLRMSEGPPQPTVSIRQVRARCGRTLPIADLYGQLGGLGLEYGPSFRGIQELHVGECEVLTRVRLVEALASTQYVLHPAFLDACLHAYPLVLDGAGTSRGIAGGNRASFLPISIERYRCYRDGIDQAWVHTALRSVETDGTQVVDIKIYDLSERLAAELDGLAVRRIPLDKVQSSRSDTDGLFYRAAWRASDRAVSGADDPRGPASWIVFADASKGVGAALAARLEAAGQRCHVIYRGDSLVQQGPRTWIVNERQPGDFLRLLRQIVARETLACNGVVYLWGLDAPSLAGLSLASLKSGSEMMCRGALAVLHALAETRSSAPLGRRLWFVTANTQQVTEGPDQNLDPVQAPLWGLGRSVAIEYPGIWGGLIDLQLKDRAPDIDLLAAELLRPDGENQIAISAGGHRYVPRFVKQSLAELPPQLPPVRGDATYLITGGLGMLGHSVAKWLIGKGAKHLVLTGRNANAEAAQNILGAAEINAAAIHVVPADIGRDEDVRRLIQTINNELPPLKGVVQSAGVLDDGILAQLDWDRFERLFEPRVYGSWLLHEHTKSLDLDFFILKSSLLSLLGSAGQGNYTASSAFLDSLATHRRAIGLPATAINWCAWSGGGLATVSGARGEAMWSGLGVKFISPDLAMQAFDSLMHRDVGQVAIADADWPTYAGQVGEPPFLAELVNGKAASGSPRFAQAAGPKTSPSKVNEDARQSFSERLQQHIMAKLGFTEAIDPDQRLNELGVDSLMSVALSNSLEKEFGQPVSVAELIKGPTINQLVDGVFSELIGTIPVKREQPPALQFLGKPIVIGEPPAANSIAKTMEVSSQHGTGRNGAAFAATRLHARPQTSVTMRVASAPTVTGAVEAKPAAGSHHDPARLRDILQRRIMTELGFTDPINPDQPLNEVGLDSLRSVALSNGLEKELGVPVSVARLLNGPSINQLADYLADELAKVRNDRPIEIQPAMIAPAVVRTVAAKSAIADTLSGPVPRVPENPRWEAVDVGTLVARDRGGMDAPVNLPSWKTAGHVAESATLENGSSPAIRPKGNGSGLEARSSFSRLSGEGAAPSSRKWLIAPRPNPGAKARLFCFPYAGGGLVSFRAWPQLLDESIELVAVEPPGRGTRIGEPAAGDLETFVARLMPEMIEWLDRPSAFFGHCLGGLTMFATLCGLPEESARFVKYSFACGIRPPNLLRRRGLFEDNLAYDMMLHRGFDSKIPPYAQEDDIFADIIRHFDTPAADRMLEIPKLRKLLLPTIRAEFGMAFNYRYQPVEPFPFPIASFIGDADPWVSIEDSAGWGKFTRGGFVNHVRKGSHFLMEDDREYILDTINKTFMTSVLQ